MKEYTIRCNREQLELLRSAVELQMRVRAGQGWAITENLRDIAGDRYTECKDAYDKLLDVILQKIVFSGEYYRNPLNWIERDMWIGIENGLGVRDDVSELSAYGLMRVEEVSE